jgi:hypothetical protein
MAVEPRHRLPREFAAEALAGVDQVRARMRVRAP